MYILFLVLQLIHYSPHHLLLDLREPSLGRGREGGEFGGQVELASLLYRCKNEETTKQFKSLVQVISWVAHARAAMCRGVTPVISTQVDLCEFLLVAIMHISFDNDIVLRY